MNYDKHPLHRRLMDPDQSNDLNDLCLCHELVIINGRFGDDKNIGKTTCDDKSTVDYMIGTSDLIEKITNFTVDTFDPLYSDKHKPVHVKSILNNYITSWIAKPPVKIITFN